MLSMEDLAELAERFRPALRCPIRRFTVGGREFTGGRPNIMGVINLSPDSWYRESVCLTAEAAISRGRVLQAQGAEIVDVGAESTLTHAARVGELDQSSKLLPVIRGLCQHGCLVSVETYHRSVAEQCLAAGARVLNLTGSSETEGMYRVAAEAGAGVIVCYVQGKNVREVADFDLEGDPVAVMYEYFARQIELADRCKVPGIWIDPGMGFYYRNLQDSATRVRHQMRVFLNSFRFQPLGVPVCHALPHAFEYFGEEVRCAEPFFAVLAALGATRLFRTHEVPRTRAVLETLGVY